MQFDLNPNLPALLNFAQILKYQQLQKVPTLSQNVSPPPPLFNPYIFAMRQQILKVSLLKYSKKYPENFKQVLKKNY